MSLPLISPVELIPGWTLLPDRLGKGTGKIESATMTTMRKILLVEDDATHAELVCRFLRNAKAENFEVRLATNLADATNKLTNESFDVALVDLGLPDSTIPETLELVVGKFPKVPVIVLTALSDLEFAARTVQQGAQDFLVKTELSSDVLRRAIRYAIERKRVFDQLHQNAMKLEDSNKRLENFAHTLAHEIRSPLTVISGCLQIIQRSHGSDLAEGTSQLLQDSLTAVRGMSDLVEGLLEFAKSDSQRRSVGSVDLESVFHHVCSALRATIKETDAVITHDPLPVVIGNETQLRQLLQNLLVNAIKYRREQPPVIRVSIKAESDSWVISVADNGIGIPESDQERIFSAFTRLDCPKNVPGVGIGLAFCKRIIDDHAGRIWVTSKPSLGSTFHFSLPRTCVPLS